MAVDVDVDGKNTSFVIWPLSTHFSDSTTLQTKNPLFYNEKNANYL